MLYHVANFKAASYLVDLSAAFTGLHPNSFNATRTKAMQEFKGTVPPLLTHFLRVPCRLHVSRVLPSTRVQKLFMNSRPRQARYS